MSVKKTFENLLPQVEWSSAVSLDLGEGQVQKPEGVQGFEIDSWPILLFLKGIGFQKIVFQPKSIDVIEIWAQRVQSIENEFIQDPENFARDEYQWNEKDLQSEQILIECIGVELKHDRQSMNIANTVPPMDAPLGITEEAMNHFLDEVRRQSPQEIFQRILSILVEYDRDVRSRNQEVWGHLIGDIVSVALNAHLLDKAVRITKDHQSALPSLWAESDRLIRLLGAYDPKANELQEWAQIFESCETEKLVSLLEANLSSEAGPQILKLMNFRAQKNPDQLLSVLRNQSVVVQKLLLQWLALTGEQNTWLLSLALLKILFSHRLMKIL